MFKSFCKALSRLLFGNPDSYSDLEYYCTRCDASKEAIWTEGCKAMEPCQTAPLATRKKRK